MVERFFIAIQKTYCLMIIGWDAKRVYHNFTGLGNYSRDLIRQIISQYEEYDYFLYATSPSKRQNNLNFLDRKNVYTVFPTTLFDRFFKNIWRTFFLEKQLIKNKVTVFHGLSNEIPRKSKNSKVKYVVTIHDLIFKRYPKQYKPIDRWIYHLKTKYAVQKSDIIIAISQQTKEDIIAFYGIDDKKIQVIYQSCHDDFKKSYTEEVKNKMLSKYQLPSEFILSVGTIEERKNLKTVVQAVAAMEKKIPLVVIGKKTAYYYTVIEKELKRLNLNDKQIIFLENLTPSELAIIYQQAKTFIYPSIFEGFGIPIIEALYSGVPVISSKGGCFHEAGGDNSIYVNPYDLTAMTKALDDLNQNASLRGEMIEKGKEYVKKFDKQILAKELMNLYSSV